jgi:hypothetical protein
MGIRNSTGTVNNTGNAFGEPVADPSNEGRIEPEPGRSSRPGSGTGIGSTENDFAKATTQSWRRTVSRPAATDPEVKFCRHVSPGDLRLVEAAKKLFDARVVEFRRHRGGRP